jgi:hypothetical protein
MSIKRILLSTVMGAGCAALLAAPALAQAVQVNNNDIGGTVTGPNGPEAGVWVIAETMDLPTRYAKMVVTDDQGRYLVPDLPKANYKVWVRGYGLVDSPKADGTPGKALNLTAVKAPNEAAAAQYYPAIYWYTMMKIPETSQFGAKGIPGNQPAYVNLMKNNGCVGCHQLGTKATRTLPDFWKGELPHATPKRPEGIERNIVVTTWDWSDPQHYLHDLAASDKRNPIVNANGALFGQPEYSMDYFPVLDPKTSTANEVKAPVRDADMHEMLGPGHAAMEKPLGPSAYWGEEKIWTAHFNNHNATLDSKGRVWMTAAFRDQKNEPAFCKQGSDHPSAKLAPLTSSDRMLIVYDPKTQKFEFVDTCFTTHHLNFDANDRLWTSSGGGGGVVGWVDTKVWDQTHDAAKAQGWTALVVDSNGDGKRGEYTEPNQPFDPSKDRRLGQVFYAVSVNPVDSTVWGTIRNYPGSIVRINPGPNPPETALSEVYNVPMPGYGPRGGDIDSKGVYWASLGSGHLGSFDRSKCKAPLNGPKALGDQCPEGWSFYQYPGPGFEGIGENSAESSYYTWVDQHNTSGLGNDVPVSTANLMDGLAALKDGKMISLRIPYPMGFFAKGLDGRIDDPNGGWKGRGLWVSSGDRAPWQTEGGKGNRPMAVHFQVRPNPLAD